MQPKKKKGNFVKAIEPTLKEFKFILKRVLRSPLSVAGLVLILYNVALAVFAPVICPPRAHSCNMACLADGESR